MAEERTSIVVEKFEDYSLEQLEVKKRITEEKIKEMVEYSIPYRIQKKYRIDIYRLAKYLLVIEIIVFVLGMLIIFYPVMMNPALTENQTTFQSLWTKFMIFFIIMVFSMMPTYMAVFVDQTSSLRRKLNEINRVIRIKREVAEQRHQVECNDENEKLEYKSSFKYDYKTKQPNPNLMKDVVQTVVGFLNSNGGTLKIGVSDNKQTIGIDKDLGLYNNNWDHYRLAIQDTIGQHAGSPISDFITIKRIQQEGKELCCIDILPSPKPIYYLDGNNEDLYVREGNRTRKLSGKMTVEYVKSHWPDRV
jgi:membrane protein implicated in regulation of membrane protease activity